MAPLVIRWSGDLDIGAVAGLRRELLAALDSGSDVVLDLCGVTFCDCSVVGVLVLGVHHAQQRNGSLSLTQVPDRVAVLLRLTRVDTLFQG